MDVAKSEVELFKSQYETALNQLKEAKDNLEKTKETRTHRKRYQLPELKVELHVDQVGIQLIYLVLTFNIHARTPKQLRQHLLRSLFFQT